MCSKNRICKKEIKNRQLDQFKRFTQTSPMVLTLDCSKIIIIWRMFIELVSYCKFWIYWVGVNTQFTVWHLPVHTSKKYWKFRTGNTKLAIKTGISREERICKFCYYKISLLILMCWCSYTEFRGHLFVKILLIKS